jgi:hypothetical protein
MSDPRKDFRLLNADFGTALGATLAQHAAATHGLHAAAKTMYFLTLTIVRLKSSFHEKTTILLICGSGPLDFLPKEGPKEG